MRTFILAFALAACGDDSTEPPIGDPDGPTTDGTMLMCGSTGAAIVDGSAYGESIAPVTRAVQTTLLGMPAILIDETGTGCTSPDTTVTDYLVMTVCTPAVGSYPIAPVTTTSCPSANAGAGFGYTAGGQHHLAEATTGTLTIDSVGACMTGSFTVTLESGQLTGQFAATTCQ